MIGMDDVELVTIQPRNGVHGQASLETLSNLEKHGLAFRVGINSKLSTVPAFIVSSVRTNWMGYLPADEVWVTAQPGQFGIDVAGLVPSSAEIGGADLTMKIIGSGFVESDKIYWNGSEEPTTFVAQNELTTGVSPGTATGAYAVPVEVRSADGTRKSFPLTFTFYVPVGQEPSP